MYNKKILLLVIGLYMFFQLSLASGGNGDPCGCYGTYCDPCAAGCQAACCKDGSNCGH
jgi:hypothetical protein